MEELRNMPVWNSVCTHNPPSFPPFPPLTTPTHISPNTSLPGRECYCSTSLSPQSEKLNETTRCTLSCAGNASEICGGKLALTLYNLTMIDSKIGVTGVGWSQFSSVAGYGTLAFVTFVLAAVM